MSGGSFNYLYAQEPPSIAELEHMIAELEALGYAPDAVEESRRVRAALGTDDWTAPVREVWFAMEWWRSNDSGEDDFRRALARYRGVELPDCQRCGGSGKEPGTTAYACQDAFCARGKDTRDIGEPRALLPTDAERIEHVSGAYATVDAQLGRARLALSQLAEDYDRQPPRIRAERDAALARAGVEVRELEALHDHLLALVGTPRERATREQVESP